ncbi:MAG: TIGR03364 family FAD-dependent oxidoreductase, partial [Chitinophagaceae bacterium]|nr:TIGR03364 family FAD-dependent oxidoreductase [Chitinophagaceae bacterium]
MSKTAIVIGAGIVGLATARALAMRGYRVQVIDRSPQALGASIRNFGMIWPIGQPDGQLYERAMLSRRIWKDVCREAGIWYDKVGSLHLAYESDEWQVLEELRERFQHRNYLLLDAAETANSSPAVVREGLRGSLYSPDEMIVDPRAAIARIPAWLTERWGVRFVWGQAVTDVAYPAVYAGNNEWEADEIYVCSGADFETLYPHLFASAPITKCKLQMMRLAPQPGNWRIGPALCGGLSLLHYKSFEAAGSLAQLRERIAQQLPQYLQWGIHVMVSQNQEGALTVGDSHEYGAGHDPFD